jgi:hypothetical protein
MVERMLTMIGAVFRFCLICILVIVCLLLYWHYVPHILTRPIAAIALSEWAAAIGYTVVLIGLVGGLLKWLFSFPPDKESYASWGLTGIGAVLIGAVVYIMYLKGDLVISGLFSAALRRVGLD